MKSNVFVISEFSLVKGRDRYTVFQQEDVRYAYLAANLYFFLHSWPKSRVCGPDDKCGFAGSNVLRNFFVPNSSPWLNVGGCRIRYKTCVASEFPHQVRKSQVFLVLVADEDISEAWGRGVDNEIKIKLLVALRQ